MTQNPNPNTPYASTTPATDHRSVRVPGRAGRQARRPASRPRS